LGIISQEYAAAHADGYLGYFGAAPSYAAVRVAGVYYDWDEADGNRRNNIVDPNNKFDWDDDSVPDIDRGYKEGLGDKTNPKKEEEKCD